MTPQQTPKHNVHRRASLQDDRLQAFAIIGEVHAAVRDGRTRPPTRTADPHCAIRLLVLRTGGAARLVSPRSGAVFSWRTPALSIGYTPTMLDRELYEHRRRHLAGAGIPAS